jgi:hypothetical protein
MNQVKTIAPISIEDLKKYFTDKTITYIIDYTNSTIKGQKLLTYLSNLDIPCDIVFTYKEEEEELLKEYLNFQMICNIPELESCVVQLLLEYKGLAEQKRYETFIESNKQIIELWISKLNSLTLYNMYIINAEEFKSFVRQFPIDETNDLSGVNFVSLLKREDFYDFYLDLEPSTMKFYKNYFEEYMFKGKNMYAYWATPNNPLFILTYGIAQGWAQKENQGVSDVTSV